jgi:hypothetical protein
MKDKLSKTIFTTSKSTTLIKNTMLQVFRNYNGSHFFDSADQSVSYEFKGKRSIYFSKKVLKKMSEEHKLKESV